MTNTADNTVQVSAFSIASLHDLALANNEIAFCHLCTAALAGEEWAIERVAEATSRLALWCADSGRVDSEEFDAMRLRVIRATDTTRPDGAIARSFQI